MSFITKSLKERLFAASIHLLLSLAVAIIAASLVFGFWYPYPYREISGGRELFFIVIAVDVIMGPLLTFTVFNQRKPFKELRRDLAAIAVLQLAALTYGLWTVAVSRPVHLVFEFDRFRVVHAIEVPEQELATAPPEFQRFPWTGPTTLAVRPFSNNNEKFETTLAALGGVALGARPGLWQSYEKAKSQIIQVAKPLSELKTRFPARAELIDAVIKEKNDAGADRVFGYVPMVGRDKFWTVLLDINTAEVIAFVPIDSF